MKTLIAVTTCHKFDYDMHSINDCMVLHREGMDFSTFRPPFIRETWWKDIPTTVGKKFFYGRPIKEFGLADEVFLDVPDDYAHLPYKTRALCKWALDNGYTNVFKCDDDTFVYVKRLLESGYEQARWMGRYNGGEFVAGGPGYWLNEEALRAAAQGHIQQSEWAEDIWLSRTLQAKGFKPEFNPNYVDFRRGTVTEATVAVCECTESKMKELYAGIA